MGAPWAGAQGASEAAVFSILPELATQRDGPRRPGESEILFERCSKSVTWIVEGSQISMNLDTFALSVFPEGLYTFRGLG